MLNDSSENIKIVDRENPVIMHPSVLSAPVEAPKPVPVGKSCHGSALTLALLPCLHSLGPEEN